jgi:hypothetical protein
MELEEYFTKNSMLKSCMKANLETMSSTALAEPLLGAQMDNFHLTLDTGKMVDSMVGVKRLSSMDKLKKVCLREGNLQIKLHLR